MARPDISRVHVLKGEYEYPALEIKLGKNSHPGEIERHVNQNEKGFWIYIGYSTVLTPAISPMHEAKEVIKILGSATGGLCLVVIGVMSLVGVSSKSERKRDEKTPSSSHPSPPELKKEMPEKEVYGPIKYGKPRLVKSEDDEVRPA
jgi:hypothetical protein